VAVCVACSVCYLVVDGAYHDGRVQTGREPGMVDEKVSFFNLIDVPFEEVEVESDGPSRKPKVEEAEGLKSVHAEMYPSLPVGSTLQSGYLYTVNYADSTSGTCATPASGNIYKLNTCANYQAVVAATDATTPTTLNYLIKYYNDAACTRLSYAYLTTVINYGTCSGTIKIGITTTPSSVLPSNALTKR
jgi:hypothetical protein